MVWVEKVVPLESEPDPRLSLWQTIRSQPLALATGPSKTTCVACCACSFVLALFTGLIFYMIWEVSVLFGPTTSTFDFFSLEPLATVWCAEYGNRELFGPVPEGAALLQFSMQWMFVLRCSAVLLKPFLSCCFPPTHGVDNKGEPTKTNHKFVSFVLTTIVLATDVFWFVMVIQIDNSDSTCTAYGGNLTNMTPLLPVKNTYMWDLGMVYGVCHGISIAVQIVVLLSLPATLVATCRKTSSS
jgi:hypothetical protein